MHTSACFTVVEPNSLATEHIVVENYDKLYAWTRFVLLREK